MKVTLKDNKTKESIKKLFEAFLLQEHGKDIESIINSEQIQNVIVHFNCLCEYNNTFSDVILFHPSTAISLFDDTLQSVVSRRDSNNSKRCSVKLTGLPLISEVHRIYVPTVKDISKLVAFRCSVSKCGKVQVIESTKYFRCNLCKYVFKVTRDFAQYNNIYPPSSCKNTSASCAGEKFQEVQKNMICVTNYQEIRVTERVHCLMVGVVPQTIVVCLEDSLVDSVKPGDDIIVNGIVKQRWRSLKPGKPCCIELVIQANYIENFSEMKSNAANLSISFSVRKMFNDYWNSDTHVFTLRDALIKHMFPSTYGMFFIKLSLALMLAAVHVNYEEHDVQKSSPIANHVRESPHILLIGDPGVAKSALMRSVANVSQRVILTTATGSTAAGLTASAIRDGSGWSLEAGALVLADTGVCCIDEFTALKNTESAAVHEAMENQTLSVAKAGLLSRLNTRCSVLAAANPCKTRGTKQTINALGVKSSLLSRFDLVFLLYDPINDENWDKYVTDFIYASSKVPEGTEEAVWTAELITQYFIWIKEEFNPIISDKCSELLREYYIWKRRYCSDTLVEYGRTTPRMLESLYRLTKTHARLMARNETVLMDALVAILLMDLSLASLEEVGNVNHRLMEDSPNCCELIKKILQKLKPHNLVDLEQELLESYCQSEDIWNPILSCNDSPNFKIISPSMQNEPKAKLSSQILGNNESTNLNLNKNEDYSTRCSKNTSLPTVSTFDYPNSDVKNTESVLPNECSLYTLDRNDSDLVLHEISSDYQLNINSAKGDDFRIADRVTSFVNSDSLSPEIPIDNNMNYTSQLKSKSFGTSNTENFFTNFDLSGPDLDMDLKVLDERLAKSKCSLKRVPSAENEKNNHCRFECNNSMDKSTYELETELNYNLSPLISEVSDSSPKVLQSFKNSANCFKKKNILCRFKLSDDLLDDAIRVSDSILARNKPLCSSKNQTEKFSSDDVLPPEDFNGENISIKDASKLNGNLSASSFASRPQSQLNNKSSDNQSVKSKNLLRKTEMFALFEDLDDMSDISLSKRSKLKDDVLASQREEVKKALMSSFNSSQSQSPSSQRTLTLFDSDSD